MREIKIEYNFGDENYQMARQKLEEILSRETPYKSLDTRELKALGLRLRDTWLQGHFDFYDPDKTYLIFMAPFRIRTEHISYLSPQEGDDTERQVIGAWHTYLMRLNDEKEKVKRDIFGREKFRYRSGKVRLSSPWIKDYVPDNPRIGVATPQTSVLPIYKSDIDVLVRLSSKD